MYCICILGDSMYPKTHPTQSTSRLCNIKSVISLTYTTITTTAKLINLTFRLNLLWSMSLDIVKLSYNKLVVDVSCLVNKII